MSEDKDKKNPVMQIVQDQKENILGITSSPSTTIEIAIDIKEESKLGRILGQMVYVVLEEEGEKILAIGQIISIETQNRWHQDPTFKGVIRLHGSLPHLSGRADNRLAVISVQAAYSLGKEETRGHILSTSPSTGIEVKKMTNAVMGGLMKKYEKDITYIGKVYGTDVDMPFWFRHFDKGAGGAGDAHHIGVFGKSGSGKSVTAAYMLLGYAKNKDKMNILVIDPQKQFYQAKDFPTGFDLETSVKNLGMKFEKYEILKDLYLPGDEYDLFASLLQKNYFIKRVFQIHSDRENEAALAIADYLLNLNRQSQGKMGNLNRLDETASKNLMQLLLERFARKDKEASEEETITTGSATAKTKADTKDKKAKPKSKPSEYNPYVEMIYSSKNRLDQLVDRLQNVVGDTVLMDDIFAKYWQPIVKYFVATKSGGVTKQSIKSVIEKIAKDKGNFIILDISGEKERLGSENIKAMFVRLIENEIKAIGEEFYAEGKKVNCLIVMDEAHRFIAHDSSDPQIVALTEEIIDSVRTTRKYGIGYMFITQTIESLDKEILQQTRIFGFGYGLTIGTEIRIIDNLLNNDSALQLYRSFIDPSSSGRYPFMFFGSVSPLSFTGAPLFIEVYTDPLKIK